MTSTRRIFLKQLGFRTAGAALILSSFPLLQAQSRKSKSLPRSTPEAQGVTSAGILGFLEALGRSQHEFHSFMMVRHGHVIAEGWWAPYSPTLNHVMYSMSKSFTSTAVGLAVAEGKLTVRDAVTSFFPEDLPASVSENLGAMRVKDLLSMSVGCAQDSTRTIIKEDNWVKAFLGLDIANKPGSKFLYDSGATYMCSAIVQKVTGQTVLDFLTPRLFEPLGIEGMTWELCPRGRSVGGWGLNIRTEGLAKFGQLYLQKGVWQGRQLLPAAWVDEATTAKIHQPESPDSARLRQTNDWHQGYCYQFWRCRHNAFRGDGAFGQYTIVMPEQDAVIAITSESPNMQGQLDMVWEHLLPAMKTTDKPLAPDSDAAGRLQSTLSALALTPPKCQSASPLAARVSGRTIQLQENSAGIASVSLSFKDNLCVVTILDQKGAKHVVTCGLEKWVFGELGLPNTPALLISAGKLPNHPTWKIAASGTWRDEKTFEMTWRFHETPHRETLKCRFDDEGGVQMDTIVSFTGKEKYPQLRGKLSAA